MFLAVAVSSLRDLIVFDFVVSLIFCVFLCEEVLCVDGICLCDHSYGSSRYKKKESTGSCRLILGFFSSGCGKSSLAAGVKKRVKNVVVVSRDELGSTEAVKKAMEKALKHKQNVLVDCCNMHPKVVPFCCTTDCCSFLERTESCGLPSLEVFYRPASSVACLWTRQRRRFRFQKARPPTISHPVFLLFFYFGEPVYCQSEIQEEPRHS